ncbi:class I SAM-dependent methyltransferase [bacterium]|jgi:ubiquinone/menaquinone biosynthesis C-methylase UbiE|nr:class I SAM-dependent methyltransferase [bacterium]
MEISKSYDDWSKTYDLLENKTRDLDESVTRKNLGGCRFDSALELGCGTGKNTPFLSEISKTVHAVDFSEGMISKAQKNVELSNVKYSICDITKTWPCDSQSMDLVLCSLVLEHVENLDFIFAESERTLKMGGTLYISELHPYQQYMGKKARFNSANGEQHITSFIHSISDYLEVVNSHHFTLLNMKEWNEDDSVTQPPRIATFLFERT